MSLDDRNYHFYLIFGESTSGEEPWSKAKWNSVLEPILTQLLKLSPYFSQTGLGTLQYFPRPNSTFFDVMKFGRLSWNAKSHEKWTLSNTGDGRLFAQMDCWTPMRTICAKINSAPEVYFSIWNENPLVTNAVPKFDFFMVVAVAEDLNHNPNDIVIRLSKSINAKRTVHTLRKWGGMRENNNWEFINSIQDTTTFGIYKKGKSLNIHDTAFEDIQFEPYWNVIYPD